MARQRWPAFTLSLLSHSAVVSFLLWVDANFQPPPLPRYDVLLIPSKTPDQPKIIWYKSPESLPDVDPDESFGPAKTPQGEKSPQTLITVAPDAISNRQLIRQPDHLEPLPVDVPAPNLVAVESKLPPKAFTLPPTQARPQASLTVVDAAPTLVPLKIQPGSALGAIASLQKLPPKTFVPPAARAPVAGTVALVDIPAPPSVGAQAQASPAASLEAVMVGLNPAPAPTPPGSRSGQIARAPETGNPSSGATPRTGAPVVAGVLARSVKPTELTEPPPSLPVKKTVQEIVLTGVNRTMSAPLRPSSRIIPASVEAQFARRNVYTLVIPRPAVPGYSGDWVMWFAEREPDADPGARISAPIPARKYSLAAGGAEFQGFPVSLTVQLAAVVDKTGHIGSFKVLRGTPDASVKEKVTEELGTWEFKPALHNGDPMEVDIVVEISFRLQPSAPGSR